MRGLDRITYIKMAATAITGVVTCSLVLAAGYYGGEMALYYFPDRPTATGNITLQSSHNTGGTIMGTNPGNSVTNKYGQVWGVDNLFIMGASLLPHNSAYNPTGPVGAIAYMAADIIKNVYIKNPGKLIDA